MKRRILILTDGYLDIFTAKTAVGLLRYCPDEVVAVLDRKHAGENLKDLLGVGDGVPIVDSIAAATPLRPEQFVLGVALPGGRLPEVWRNDIRQALAAGMNIVNGLHTRLNDDADLARCAAEAGRTIWDVRAVPPATEVGAGKARHTPATRVLTVGTDCNLGKRLTAMELTRELARRGAQAVFVPTGQTGVIITRRGVVIDAVVSDFVSGVVEREVLAVGDADYVVVEGQGALLHPSFSAVTLGLMHGVLPDMMILCHAPTRKTMRHADVPIPPLDEVIRLHEAILRPLHPSKIVGIALNCFDMDDPTMHRTIEEIHALTGLPVLDPVRIGVSALADAVVGGAILARQV